MRVLGIDSGYAKVGFSVIDHDPEVPELLACGTWTSNVENWTLDETGKKETKLKSTYYTEIQRVVLPKAIKLVREFKVTHVLAETVTGTPMGNRDGIVSMQSTFRTLCMFLPVYWKEVNAMTAKKVATGNYKAPKEEVVEWVKKFYSTTDFPEYRKTNMPYDMFDAIMIGTIAKEIPEWFPPLELEKMILEKDEERVR